MPVSQIILVIARPKIDFHFPDFSIDLANRSEVSALKPIHLRFCRRGCAVSSWNHGPPEHALAFLPTKSNLFCTITKK